MTVDTLLALGQRAMLVTLLASAPMLISGMVIGLLISILQSVTQIQEITLTFVPKIVVVFLAFVIFMPWMTDLILMFTRDLLSSISTIATP